MVFQVGDKVQPKRGGAGNVQRVGEVKKVDEVNGRWLEVRWGIGEPKSKQYTQREKPGQLIPHDV